MKLLSQILCVLVFAVAAYGVPPTDAELASLTLHALAWDAYWQGPLLGIDGETTLEATAYALPGEQHFIIAVPASRAVVMIFRDLSGDLRLARIIALRFQGGTLDAGIGGTGVTIFDIDVGTAVWTRKLEIRTPPSLEEHYLASLTQEPDPEQILQTMEERQSTFLKGECSHSVRIPRCADADPYVYLLLTPSCDHDPLVDRIVTTASRGPSGWEVGWSARPVLSGTSDYLHVHERFEQHPSTTMPPP